MRTLYRLVAMSFQNIGAKGADTYDGPKTGEHSWFFVIHGMRRDPRQNPWSSCSRGVETESPESTSAQHAQARADIERAPTKHHGPHRRPQHPPKSRQANKSMHATIIHSPTATATKAFRGCRRSRTASRRPTRRRSASASGSSSKFWSCEERVGPVAVGLSHETCRPLDRVGPVAGELW